MPFDDRVDAAVQPYVSGSRSRPSPGSRSGSRRRGPRPASSTTPACAGRVRARAAGRVGLLAGRQRRFALKKPFCVGISWSSPWRIPEVLCVAG